MFSMRETLQEKGDILEWLHFFKNLFTTAPSIQCDVTWVMDSSLSIQLSQCTEMPILCSGVDAINATKKMQSIRNEGIHNGITHLNE